MALPQASLWAALPSGGRTPLRPKLLLGGRRCSCSRRGADSNGSTSAACSAHLCCLRRRPSHQCGLPTDACIPSHLCCLYRRQRRGHEARQGRPREQRYAQRPGQQVPAAVATRHTRRGAVRGGGYGARWCSQRYVPDTRAPHPPLFMCCKQELPPAAVQAGHQLSHRFRDSLDKGLWVSEFVLDPAARVLFCMWPPRARGQGVHVHSRHWPLVVGHA